MDKETTTNQDKTCDLFTCAFKLECYYRKKTTSCSGYCPKKVCSMCELKYQCSRSIDYRKGEK